MVKPKMFKNILVFCRGHAEDFAKEPHEFGSAVVSIKTREDPSDPYIKFTDTNNIKEILFMAFNDVENEVEGGITYKEAYRIAEFVRHIAEHRDDVETLVVHCDAGASRSAGVAAAVAKYYFKDDEDFFKRYTPNARCYRLVLEELMQADDK